MLQFLRKSVSSWVGILVLALALGAMVLTMFQGQGPGGGGSTTQQGNVLVTVGDRAILDTDYTGSIDRAVQRERERSPELTNAQFVAAGAGDMLLQQMIATKAMQVFGEANRMAISRRMIDGEIASIPAFQVNGKFDDATFRRLLAQQQLGEGELRDSIAADLLRRQLLQPVMAGSTVPQGMTETYTKMLLEQRKGVILPIPSAAMADPGKPTDKQLQEFHTAHKADYTIPERRAFRFAELDRAQLAAQAKPTADAVRKYYDEHQGEFGGLETREVQQIVLPDEAKAKAFAATVRGGTPFVTAAKAEGFGEGDVSLGALSQEQLAKQISEEVAKAAFALPKGAVSDPLKSKFGWTVLSVGAVHPAKAAPFASVAGDIEKRLADDKLADLLSKTVADAEDRLSEGQSFADVAKALGVAVQTVPALTRDGRLVADDYTVTRVAQPVLPKAFAAAQGDGPQVVELAEDHFALLEVTDVIPPTLAPLDKIRPGVEQAWAAQARSDAAKAVAERIAASLDKGEPMDKATAGQKHGQPQVIAVRRLELMQMANEGRQVPPPVSMLLNTPSGKAGVIAAPGNQGWFVVKVNDVQPGDPSDAAQLSGAVRPGLVRDAGTELAESYVRAIEREAVVVRKPASVKAVNQRLTGALDSE